MMPGPPGESPVFGADLDHLPRIGDALRFDGHPLTQGRRWRVVEVEWRLETTRRGDRPEVQPPPSHQPAVTIILAEVPACGGQARAIPTPAPVAAL